jgi:cryptochrome
LSTCIVQYPLGAKWDKSGVLAKKFCPELEDVPNKFIYDPWKAPNLKEAGVELVELDETFIEKLRDAEKKGPGRRRDAGISSLDDGMELETDDAAGLVGMGVRLGEGKYPRPMFDFDVTRRVCIDRMKEAYHVGLYGNDPRVLDGSWPELFEEGPHDDILGEAAPERFAEDIYEEDVKVVGEKGSGHGLSDDEGGAKQVGEETKGGKRTEDAKKGDGGEEEQESRGKVDKRSRTRR